MSIEITFLENFRFSSVNFVSFGWKVLIAALTWDKKMNNKHCSLTTLFTLHDMKHYHLSNKLEHI